MPRFRTKDKPIDRNARARKKSRLPRTGLTVNPARFMSLKKIAFRSACRESVDEIMASTTRSKPAPSSSDPAAAPKKPARTEAKRDPAQTKRDILAVAAVEFAERGLSGARVDEIAARMRTTKAMLYYYFKSKEGLYQAVLEEVYARTRAMESDLQLEHLEPEVAMRRLIEVTFDHYEANPDYVRFRMTENIHRAAHLKRLPGIASANASVIRTIASLLARGGARGVFRRPADPVALHLLIVSLCCYRVSNQHTFGTLFGRELWEADGLNRYRSMVVEVILNWLMSA